jgi:hypothetical protein
MSEAWVCPACGRGVAPGEHATNPIIWESPTSPYKPHATNPSTLLIFACKIVDVGLSNWRIVMPIIVDKGCEA